MTNYEKMVGGGKDFLSIEKTAEILADCTIKMQDKASITKYCIAFLKDECEQEEDKPNGIFDAPTKAYLSLVNARYNWVARDRSCELWFYECKPFKDNHSPGCWASYGEYAIVEEENAKNLFGATFENIKWEDDAPCLFRDHLK